MFVDIKNENYGYSAATYGDYVTVANPPITRFNFDSSSLFFTGSVDYFRYNKNTDEHDYIGTLIRPWIEMEVILSAEFASSGLYTEYTASLPHSHGLCIDKDLYTASVDDGFGLSLDMYNKYLVVGCPYYTELVETSASMFPLSGSMVLVYDLGLTEYAYFNPTGSILIGRLNDPDLELADGVSGSFGMSVTINRDWLVVGSPQVSGSQGMVYVYRNESTESQCTWSLYQKINPPSDVVSAAEFGSTLKLNKCSSSYDRLIIGCGNPYNNKAYFYELVSGSWIRTFTFLPDNTVQSMTFANYMPYQCTTNAGNGFGTAVSMYDNVVIIGEYLDRIFYEYSGSSLYEQGSVYIFEQCINPPYITPPNVLFRQVLKTYGTPETLKSNRMGFSVDIFGNNALAGIPKTDVFSLTSCYVGSTIEQLHQCPATLDNTLNGQSILIQKNTSSGDWEITNVYQKKKKYLSPYRAYGFDVAIADRSMVVGAPLYLSDANRKINIFTTQSNNIVLDDVAGKAYIYNLKNLRDEFHVGNVFYRNGKIILMTSGSIFDGLCFNPVNTSTYEYDLEFKGQHTIFEKQIVCSVSPGEFNVSTNPTAINVHSSSLDVNKNGKFDFQDLDIILRYMQYKNTSILGVPVTTDWSSSLVKTDDEISLLNWYQQNYSYSGTDTRTSESIVKWETTDTWMQILLDLNEDNRIDIRDMNIMWKYFTNRLTQENYASYITPACQRKLFSDVMDYMNFISQRTANPLIEPAFLSYETSVTFDKTGSYLAPMVTTIGLYSGLDLVCVSKLGNPIKITPELPINFVVKMDF